MAYNKNNFWVPNTYEEIVLIYLNKYNEILRINGLPEVGLDFFNASGPRFALETALEIDVQIQILLANVFNEFVKALQVNSELQPAEARGSTLLGVTNALKNLDTVTHVKIDQPNNKVNTTVVPGQIAIAMNYNDEKLTSQTIWEAMNSNIAVGINTKEIGSGNIQFSASGGGGSNATYNWTKLTTKPIKIKLFFTYSNNYKGNLITSAEIIEIYKERFKTIATDSITIEPSVLNDVSEYPKNDTPPYVLQNLDSQFSIDDGTTYLPLNEPLDILYNELPEIDGDIQINEITSTKAENRLEEIKKITQGMVNEKGK